MTKKRYECPKHGKTQVMYNSLTKTYMCGRKGCSRKLELKEIKE